MNDTTQSKYPDGIGLAVSRVALASFLVIFVGYLIAKNNTIEWPDIGWLVLFSVLAFAISYLDPQSGHRQPAGDPPGLFTLRTLIFVLAIVYVLLLPDSDDFIDSVASHTWPVVLGSGIGWMSKSIFDLACMFRGSRR